MAMLRKVCRTVIGKQAAVTDHGSRTSPHLNSPPLLQICAPVHSSSYAEYFSKPASIHGTESPLDHFLCSRFWRQDVLWSNNSSLQDSTSRAIGLRIVVELIREADSDFCAGSPKSPTIRIDQAGYLMTNCSSDSLHSRTRTKGSPLVLTRPLSPREVELSEEYSRAISHGSNPKISCVLNDRVTQRFHVGAGFSGTSSDVSDEPPLANFLRFCGTCRKKLDHKEDIYMYRGEIAFCSRHCRYLGMLSDGVDGTDL